MKTKENKQLDEIIRLLQQIANQLSDNNPNVQRGDIKISSSPPIKIFN